MAKFPFQESCTRCNPQHGSSNNCTTSDIWPTIFALTAMPSDCTNLSLNPCTAHSLLFPGAARTIDVCTERPRRTERDELMRTAHRAANSSVPECVVNCRSPFVCHFQSDRMARRRSSQSFFKFSKISRIPANSSRRRMRAVSLILARLGPLR